MIMTAARRLDAILMGDLPAACDRVALAGGRAVSAGPFETEQQARDTDAVQAIWAAFRADPGMGKMAPHSLAMLEEACAVARVELGAFDRRVLAPSPVPSRKPAGDRRPHHPASARGVPVSAPKVPGASPWTVAS